MDSGKLLSGLVKSPAGFRIDSGKGGLTIDPPTFLVTDLAVATMPERFVKDPRSKFPRSNLRLTLEGRLIQGQASNCRIRRFPTIIDNKPPEATITRVFLGKGQLIASRGGPTAWMSWIDDLAPCSP